MQLQFITLIYTVFSITVFTRVKSDGDFQINMNHWLIDYNNRVSSECALQLNISIQNAQAILKMIDATTKSFDGLLVGSLYHLGNFDECYNIVVENPIRNFHGKYCLGMIKLTSAMQKIENNQNFSHFRKIHNLSVILTNQRENIIPAVSINLGICLPSGCSANDANQFTKNFIEFSDDYCYSKDTEPELTTGAIVTIVILAIFLGIAVVSTIYDVSLFYKKSSPSHPLLIAFSLFTNGKKLIKTSANSDQLLCLNGIKAISMIWVILGHTYSLSMSGPLNNTAFLLDWMSETINMFMMGGTVSVDTFFMVGGLLTTYAFLKATDKGIKLNIPLYYLHRYIRLTPALGITMLVVANLVTYLGNGPLWNELDNAIKPCQNNWWLNLLYIQNYYHEMFCLGPSWYLAVDMQLFLLSPFILLPLKRWPKLTLYAIGGLIVFGIIIDFVISKINNLTNVLAGGEDFMWIIYVPMHTRYNVYLIGMILGYFIYKYKANGKAFIISPGYVLISWLIVLAGLAACVFAGHDYFMSKTDVWENATYNALNRPAWAVAVAGVIYLCVIGYGGPINAFLSHAIFQFLAKVSYSMYLVHYVFIGMRYYSSRHPLYINNFDYLLRFWGFFMYVLLISTILCVMFESPMIIIEKSLFGRVRKEKKSEKGATT